MKIVDPEIWASVEAHFDALRELSPEKRADALEAIADQEVRRQVAALLEHSGEWETLAAAIRSMAAQAGVGAAQTHSDPDNSPTEASHSPTQTMGAGETAGTVIGRYRLLQKIGEGGMGEVWLAEQREPVRRRVALKLVKAGMNTREVIARFESERQALALMEHPAIAKVLDAGSTDQGAPYFVMEYVAGVPITAYCDNHRLNTRRRLELFMQVCEGVQHAHQKAIIHRDLKPSNILVLEVDGRPAPKIIDFGVAKALTQKLTADTVFTHLGALVGTPEYMSPEQADFMGGDIDTRTDIYSLGIVLYEMLAGAPPLDLRKIAFEEFLRRLREEEPPKPSTKVRTQDHATSTEVARKRQTEPVALLKQIRGDLDSIALKALEKDRSRRYSSASDFAADIRRYLNNEPVIAVPPSAAYRARKFARRYRVALATVCAFVLVLIVAAGVSIWQSIRATRQRDRADAAAAVAQAISDFLQNDLLEQASSSNQAGKLDPDLKVRTALDRAAARIAGKFDRQPEVEAEIRDTIGRTYRDLGQYADARLQLQRALELYRRTLGADNPKTVTTMRRLANTAALVGNYAEAEALLNETVQVYRRVLGPEHRDTLGAMSNLAITYSRQGKYAQAGALLEQVLPIQSRRLGPEHPNSVGTMNTLANNYFFQGKYADAASIYTKVVEIWRRTESPDHPDVLTSTNNLADADYHQGKYAEAEALLNQVLAAGRRVLGPEHPFTLGVLSDIAAMYQAQGKYQAAATYVSECLAGRRRALGPEAVDTVDSAADLALAYLSLGKFAASEPLAREAVETNRRKRPDGWQRFRDESLLGASLAGQKKYAEAEPLLLAGYQGMAARKDRIAVPDQIHLDSARQWLVQLYQAMGNPAKAAEWRDK